MEIEEKRRLPWWTFDNLSYLVLLVSAFILPVFTMPFWGTSLEVSKKFLVFLAVLLSAGLWFIGRLQEGKVSIPKTWFWVGSGALVLSYLLSSIFSSSFWVSYSGAGFEQDTFLSIFLLSLLTFLVAVLFQERKRFFTFYLGLFIASLVVYLVHLVGLIVFQFNFLGFIQPFFASLFGNLEYSLLGKWYDLAVYAGFVALSSLVMLEFFTLEKTGAFRLLLKVCLGVSILFLVFINYYPVWIVLGLFSLFVFIYKISFLSGTLKKSEGAKNAYHVLMPSFLLVLLALLFIILGPADKPLGDLISKYDTKLGFAASEVKPNWLGTYEIAKGTWKKDFLLGAGPNRFINEWTKQRPVNVLSSDAWNVDFRYGVGLIPSVAVTGGLLGVLAWLSFLGCILWCGLRFLFKTSQEKGNTQLLMLSFLGTLYLWIFSFIYVPNNTLLTLAFLMTGLFLATSTEMGLFKSVNISLVKNPRYNFAIILAFVLLIVASITGGYLVTQKFLSLYVYQKGLTAVSVSGNLNEGRMAIENALNLSTQDFYYRSLSDIYLLDLNRLISQTSVSSQEFLAQSSVMLDSAVKSAQAGTELDPDNYANWLQLGKVYGAMVPLGVQGAYEQAKISYEKAQALSPNNPAILVENFARLEVDKKDFAKAEEYIKKAVTLRPLYPAAVSLWSQIESSKGNDTEAIKILDSFLYAYPNYLSVDVLFQSGYLNYKNGNYAEAVQRFERIVSAIPSFSNARYFLGLSYEKLGNNSKALEQFKEIAKYNPDNSEVKSIIANLTAGRPAVSGEISTSKPVDEEEPNDVEEETPKSR